MGNQSSNSHDIHTRRVSSGAGARTGIAKDQLIFIIICAVALTVAAVTLVHSFSSRSKVRPSTWQCVDCGKEFKKVAQPPVECPKCGGVAERLGYRACGACGKKVLYCRMHIQSPPEGAAGPAGGLPGPRMLPGIMQPVSMQYWVKQEDGSFAWSQWMLVSSPQAQQMNRTKSDLKATAGGLEI